MKRLSTSLAMVRERYGVFPPLARDRTPFERARRGTNIRSNTGADTRSVHWTAVALGATRWGAGYAPWQRWRVEYSRLRRAPRAWQSARWLVRRDWRALHRAR